MANFGAAVGADDGIYRLTEHIEGDAESDPEEVLLGVLKGLLIDPPAKGGEQGLLEDQVEGGDHKAADDAEQNGAADAFVGVLLSVGAKADADKGAAAVANHHRHS